LGEREGVSSGRGNPFRKGGGLLSYQQDECRGEKRSIREEDLWAGGIYPGQGRHLGIFFSSGTEWHGSCKEGETRNSLRENDGKR